jgi:prepilin-type N-terminal cleavage/methylation domain-containing protein
VAKLSIFHFTKKLGKNQRGFSITEVLAAAAISGMVVLGTSSIFVDSAKVESGQERQFWLAARRMEFQGVIRSQTGWNSILANNSDMSCFAAPTGCAAYTSPQPLKLPLDTNILDGTKTTVGMNNKGELCNTFDATNGNPLCPVGIQLHWTALCDDVNCFHAQPKVTIQFQSKDVGHPLEKLSSYDLIAFKDPKLESLNEVCTAMGGVLVGITCSVTSLATACDPSNTLGAGATYPLGFDATGKVLCGKPNPGSCAASDVATGFNANGGIVCAPACN